MGVVTAPAVLFNGTASVTLLTTLDTTAITSQSTLTIATAATTMMVVDSGSLSKITKENYLADVYPNLISTGMIMAYATTATTATIAAGWLYCDGSEYISTSTTCTNLFNLIGYRYGTPIDPFKFKVPNMTTSTFVTTGTNTGTYIFYHIKR